MRNPFAPQTSEIFGLIAWLENSRIQLPLRAVDCRFRVTGEVAVVELDQVFHQTAAESLDVTYTFPLPHGAAVYRCEMHVNGRVIMARVMEEAEALRVVAEQKQMGHRTALVQADRENVFRLELGNLAPGDIVVLRLAYFQTVDRLETQLGLRIPFCPGIRYIPGKPLLRANVGKGTVDDTDEVPDASRISPPRIGRDHEDAAELHIEGSFDAAEVALATLSSPTHPVIVRPRENVLELRLAENGALPDRDFVMRWEESPVAQAQTRTWSTRDEQGTYALMQVRAPHDGAVQKDWEQDVYFLVDRSGSMQGEKWTKCAEALQAFVRELGENDCVWITFFESEFQDFSDAPMPARKLLADTGFMNIARLGTAGGTELLPALRHVLEVKARCSKGRRTRIVLITDGEVGNDAAILQAFDPKEKTPVYCFGIDTAVNDSFLRQLSSRQGGRCALMTPHDDIPAAVRRLASALRRPVLTGLALSEGWTAADGMNQLPDLHVGEITTISVRATTATVPALQITGKRTDGSAWMAQGTVAPGADPAPRLVWAQRRIGMLLSERRRADAVALAVQHNLACVGASFVAWDDSEKVPVAKCEVYQPSMYTTFHVGGIQKASLCAAPPPDEFFAPSPPTQMLRMREDPTADLESAMPQPAMPKPAKPKLDLEAVKARYVRGNRPSWLGGERDLPLKWAAGLVTALGGGSARVRKLVTLLGWLLYDWSNQKETASRQARVEALLLGFGHASSPLAELEKFIFGNVSPPHFQDALDLIAAVRSAAVAAP